MFSRLLPLVLAVLPLPAFTIQPSAKSPVPNQEFRDLKWGQLNFLHTTDTHGWHAGHLQEPQYSADFGDYMSFVFHMRRIADERGVDLLLVDTGDRGEGNGLWDASDPKGKYTRSIFKNVGIDVLTIGNHELYKRETALNEFFHMVPHYQGRYLASNVDINVNGAWGPLANRSYTFTTEKLNLRITSFGFLFNFTWSDINTRVTPVSESIQQRWFQEAIADTNVDIFLLIGHIDLDALEWHQIHDAIRALHPRTPIQVFAGHSHIRKFRVFDEFSTVLESGRYCESIGFLSIDNLIPKNTIVGGNTEPPGFFRRYIDFNRLGFQHHTKTNSSTFDTPEGLRVTAEMSQYRHTLGLDRIYGCAPQTWTLWRDPYPSANNWYSFLIDKLLPEMVNNTERSDIPRMIFINTGSQRFDIYKGPFTYDTSFLVSPFTSRFYFAKNVNYNAASQLLDFFENDPSQYSARYSAGYFQPVGNDESDFSPIHRFSLQNQQLLNIKPVHARVPGYTTKDAFGTDGDDTIHDWFPKYPIPKVVQSNVAFPENWEEQPPETVDIVFFDFIGPHVVDGLNSIMQEEKYSMADFELYMGWEDTLTSLLLKYVSTHWMQYC